MAWGLIGPLSVIKTDCGLQATRKLKMSIYLTVRLQPSRPSFGPWFRLRALPTLILRWWTERRNQRGDGCVDRQQRCSIIDALTGFGLFLMGRSYFAAHGKGSTARCSTKSEEMVNKMQRTRGSWIHRAHQYVAVLIVVLVTTTALCAERAGAQDRSATAEERQACTPDVFRLCSSHIPDADAITACLKARSSSLSDRCRYVMSVRDAAKGKASAK